MTENIENIENIDNSIFNDEIDWFNLDNAAKIYPASATKNWNAVFRISVVVNEVVDRSALQKALNDVIVRFPTFQCTLKKGMFWHYLQRLSGAPTVQEDIKYPCQKMALYENKHIIRVLTYKNRIALEVFHSVCDGTGALIFLNTLLKRYFEIKGRKVSDNANTLELSEQPTNGEVEDSFLKYANDEKIMMRSSHKAFTIRGAKEKRGVTHVTSLIMSDKQLKEIAKKYDCSITHLISGVMMLAINDLQANKRHKLPVVEELPINLRRIFPSQTIRNFSYFTQVTFNPNKAAADLQTAVDIVKDRLAECTQKKWLIANINANVKDEKNIALRIVPRFLKDFGMSIAAYLYSDRAETLAFSAIGKVAAPQEFAERINRYEFLIAPPKVNNYSVSSASYNDHYVLSFTSKIAETKFEDIVVSKLTELGAQIAYETNRE